MSITILSDDPFEDPRTTVANPATPKQQAFIDRLLAERDYGGTQSWVGPFIDHYRDGATIDRRQASSLIDVLTQCPRIGALPTRETDVSTPTSTPALSPGMYMVGERIFKVQLSGAGHLYAKELIDGHFEYAAGSLREIHADDRMTLEQAKAYGVNTGTCCVCGRTLTNEVSIAEGIGPVCAGRI